ncbi:protein of unknown function [Chryseobacterium soldanellicola]|uniref:DUF1835 domain-containing protein n=1 Tax=Chryseobacterium soldanellicola TaxID=311333 RepID=A0A1H1AUM6_9FLAO|nr:DUF1835 domain-containing protein [Chryseobacterium soldanellicola]SDQ43352.1 protein of unknown function [Chryseobacterium soldanellicola]
MNTIFHITNGDYLAGQLKEISVDGEIIICREALVSGPLKAGSLEEFWKIRSEFILKNYNASSESYYKKVVSEFEKMINIPEGSEVNLWFEDDLFCQVNLWFCISLLSKNKDLKIYRVFPKTSEKDHWKGFSVSTNSDLEESLRSKVLFKEKDIKLALNLWKAYQSQDNILLKQLSEEKSDCFYFLKEVINTYVNKNPDVFIKNLIESGTTDFNLIFEKFQEELGILGFGDLQVKSIYDKIVKNN